MVALTASTTAFAQDAIKTLPTKEATKEVDEVVVTGSRIARTEVDTVRPVSAVGAVDLDKRALVNVGDAIKELPSVGQGIGPFGTQNAFTVGQNYVDLFNLGSQRTLTLVNGRRFVSSNVPSNFSSAAGLQVDYNVLPVALLDRVEVVPLAGAAVYGSDAIAGTINVILKDHYQGFEMSAQQGLSEKSDLAQRQISGVMGTNFADDRGNVTFSLEYNKSDGALASARPDWNNNRPLAIPFGARLDANGNGTADQEYRIYFGQNLQVAGPYGSVSPTSLMLPSLGLGKVGANYYQFTKTGDLASCAPGITPGASSALFTMGGGCGFDLVGSTTQIRSPVTVLNATMLGHYDITDDIRFSVESMFSNSQATQLIKQGGYNLLAFGGTSGPLLMNTSNPFLDSQARGILESALGPNANFFINRFDNDLVGGGPDMDQNYTGRVATILDGKFDLGERKFKWNLSGVFGKAHLQNKTSGIIDGRLFDALDAVKVDNTYLNGLVTQTGSTITDLNKDGKVDASDALLAIQKSGQSGVQNIGLGSIICNVNGHIANGTAGGYNTPAGGSGTVGTAYPFGTNCLPLNIFGDARAVNSAATLNFITGGPRVNTADNEERVLTASITGDLFRLPAGWVSANVGVEARRERAVFTPDLGSSLTITRGAFATYTTTGGSQETQEYFGELFAPIFGKDTDVPLMNLLEFNGSIRRVEEKSKDINNLGNGTNHSTAFEYGGRWSPVKDLIFRGSYTQAIRSPSLVELYTPQVGSFSMANDPCDQRYVNSGVSPAIRRANCIAAGIDPNTFISNAVSATIPIITSGNPNLVPEESKSYTFGVVVQPRWIDRLALTLDYFHIRIENRISPLSLTQVLNACYDSPSFPNTPACSGSLFTRDGTGQIISGTTTSLNAANSLFEAVQGHLTYGVDVADALKFARLNSSGGDFGDLSFSFTLLKTMQNELQVLNELPTNPVGTFAQPKWKGTFDVTYNWHNWRVFWRTLYQSSPVFLDTTGTSYLVNLGPGQETTAATNANIINHFDPYFMSDVSIQYNLRDKTSIQFSVNNVFNMMPSVINRADGAYYTSDEIGRYFVLRIRQQF
ncbi:MAG: TonB-dependent receptor [Proteobacteria bacterium]|nr:TonB-dependent receptor [Pseudomonadota bacterium]